jgi:hypothetical protein
VTARGLAGLVLVLAALLGLGCSSASAGESWVSVTHESWSLGFEVTGELKASHSDAIGPPQIPGIGQYKIARMAPEGAQSYPALKPLLSPSRH